MDVFDLTAKIGLDTKDYDSKLEESKSKLSGLKDGIGKIGGLLSSTAKVAGAALTAASAGVVKITKQSLDAYGSYEQLKGGVETLFGDSAQKVLANSEQAFKTAGMSMNEYMETSIQSAAALINSLDGDTAKAADLMDVSITDMADNVNKMGTTMEAVQNAYRGFSRGNFTMLDNLALGFSGTKEGMQQLLDKAKEISGVEFDISSYSDIVQAIHVVQEEMGVSGTTAKEAAGTIQGSLFSTQAAWKNLVTNLARDDADISGLIDTLVSSIENTASNIIPRLEIILGGVADLIEKLAPIIVEKLPPLVTELVPKLITSATQVITALASALPMLIEALLPPLVDGVVQVIGALVGQLPTILQVLSDAMPMVIDAIVTVLPLILQAGADILFALAGALTANMDTLIPAIVDLVIQIADMIVDNLDRLIDAAIEIIIALADALVRDDTLTKLSTAIPQILTKIVDVLVEHTPDLLLAAVEIIASLADYLLVNLPIMWDAGMQFVEALIGGIDSMIGDLIELLNGIGYELGYLIYDWVQETVNWISEKWEAFKSWWTGVFEALGQWIYDKMQNVKDRIRLVLETLKAIWQFIWEGMKNRVKEIWTAIRDAIWKVMDTIKSKIDKVKEIKDTFVEAFQTAVNYIKELPAKALQWGKDLIDNFVGGIKAKADAVVEGVKGVASSVKSFLGFSEPEKGPLSDFHTFAPDMMQLFAQGIDKGKVDVLSSVERFADDIAGYMAMDGYSVGANYSGSVSRSDTTANAGISYAGATININVSGVDMKNPRGLAERIAEELATLNSDNNNRIGAWAL